jgi:hypothetical protein
MELIGIEPKARNATLTQTGEHGVYMRIKLCGNRQYSSGDVFTGH